MKSFFSRWKKIALRLADAQIGIILTIVYFPLFLPYALVRGVSKLCRPARRENSAWSDYENPPSKPSGLQKQGSVSGLAPGDKDDSTALDGLRRQF